MLEEQELEAQSQQSAPTSPKPESSDHHSSSSSQLHPEKWPAPKALAADLEDKIDQREQSLWRIK